MDRAEARAILESMKLIDFRFAPKSKATEALDLAIEALQEKLQLSEEISTNTLTCNHTCNKKQVTGKLNNPDDSLLTEDSEACKEQESKLESDLISRQAAIDAVEKAVFKGVAKSAIESLPPVTPTERTGEWIIHRSNSRGLADLYECDQCGEEVVAISTKYCPDCGAKMKGDKE